MASGLAVGFVLALQMYYALVTYGAAESLGLIVNLSLVRELGPGGHRRCSSPAAPAPRSRPRSA